MIGLLTVAKKAMTVGYRRYGLPGAIALGVLTFAGYVALRRALDAAAESDRAGAAVDAETLRAAVENDGVAALTDPTTLAEAVDVDALVRAIDDAIAQSSRSSAT